PNDARSGKCFPPCFVTRKIAECVISWLATPEANRGKERNDEHQTFAGPLDRGRGTSRRAPSTGGRRRFGEEGSRSACVQAAEGHHQHRRRPVQQSQRSQWLLSAVSGLTDDTAADARSSAGPTEDH